MLKHFSTPSWPGLSWLVPATSIAIALCLNNRGHRDKPGDDRSGVIQIYQKPLKPAVS
jgi:hypothetical protein